MVDFTGNPYLTDPRFQLSDDQMRQYRLGSIGAALTNFGAGIAASGASGQPWFAGIAPGAAAASGALSQQQAQLAHMQEAAAKYQQMEDYRKGQEAHLAAEDKRLGIQTGILQDNADFNKRMRGVALDVVNGPQSVPGGGVNVQPPPYQMGPRSGFDNNLGNLRVSGAPWQGKGAPFNGFETFDTPQSGAAAMYKNLQSYAQSNPGMTVGDAIAKWAPPSENNTGAYVGRIAQAGIDPRAPLGTVLQDPASATKLMSTMAAHEKGHQFAPEIFSAAVGGQPQQAGSGAAYAALPPFQGPGVGAPALQPGALPPGVSPQMTPGLPATGAPPGMAVGDGGPSGSPAGAGPQVAQAPAAPQQPGSFDPGPPPQRDPRAKMLLMSPETKALGEAMDRDYQSQLELWKWKQTEARQGRGEEMKLRQEANKMVPFGPGQNYEPSTDTVYVTDPIAGNSSYKLHGGTPPAQSEVGTPEPANPNAPPVAGNEDFLKTLPPATANLVKAYAEGRMPIPTAAALRNPSMARLMAAVQQYDPSFDAANYQARKNFLTSSTSGTIFNNVIAPSNKFLNHASSYLDAYDKLGMDGGLWSYAGNPLKLGELKAKRSGEYMAAETNLQGVKDEFAKFMGGKGQLTDLARKLESDLSITSSPAETYATIGKMKELMQGQLEPVAQQRRDLFKQGAPGDFIQPKGQEAITRIERGPTQIDKNASMRPPPSAPPPKINTKAEFDKLKSGDLFEAPNGVIKVKP